MLFQSITKDDHGSSTLRPVETAGPLAELHFVLSGKLTGRIPGQCKLTLSSGEYTLIYRPSAALPFPFSAGFKAITFTIGLPVQRLQTLTIAFPMLFPFLEKMLAGKPCRLTRTPGMADLKIIGAIRNIMDCAYCDDIRHIYWDLLVSDLVILALIGLHNTDAAVKDRIALKPLEIEKIQASRNFLLQNMEHPPTLIALARKVGLNDFKLKKAYKQLYGTTLFEDFLHARMKKAKELLETTDQSIVAIAELTGYKNVSSFSVAFKKYCGVTPGEYRNTI